MSHGARCRLSADVEARFLVVCKREHGAKGPGKAEMQKFGLRLLDGGQHTFRDKLRGLKDQPIHLSVLPGHDGLL